MCLTAEIVMRCIINLFTLQTITLHSLLSTFSLLSLGIMTHSVDHTTALPMKPIPQLPTTTLTLTANEQFMPTLLVGITVVIVITVEIGHRSGARAITRTSM